MPDFVTGLPPWGVVLALIGVVVLAVVVIVGLFMLLGSAVRPAPSEDGPTLAEAADPLLRDRGPVGRFDRRFDRMIEGTQLGISGDTATGWILLIAALAAVGALVVALDDPYAEFWTAGAFLAGGLLAFLFFAFLRTRRRRAIQEQLPDGCFQLARSLRAGLNLPDAMKETTNYVSPPLSRLFMRAATAISLGERTGPALQRVADDAATTEFDLLASVLTTHAERGGNLPAMLDRLAASIRDRNQYRGYFRAVTALGRASAVFLALAAPVIVILMLIFQEEMFMKFVRSEVGAWLIGAAVVLEVIGLVWLAFLLRREDDI